MSFNNQWIEIFKVGEYGGKGTYDQAKLDEIVRNFDPANWQPVLTPPTAQIGHADMAPALGVVSAVRRDGDRLLAQFEKVHPQLEESVRDGRFPNRSVGLYNSNKQGLVLRHVAFLGAMPPEVKGMAPVKFSDGDFVVIEFKEEDEMNEPQLSKEHVSILTRLAEGFRNLVNPAPAPAAPAFDESKFTETVKAAVKAEVTPLQAQITTLSDENKKLREQNEAAVKGAAVSEVRTYAEGLKKAGKWVPALDGILPIIETAAAGGQKVKFTEGAGDKAKEVELPAFEAFKRFADSLGQIVPLGELAGGKRTAKRGDKVVQFRDGVDPHSALLNDRAQEIAADLRKANPAMAEHVALGQALKQARVEMGDRPPVAGIAAGAV